MENDEAKKEKRDNNRLVLSIISKVRSALIPEKNPPLPPSEAPFIDPHLWQMYQFIKTTLSTNSYEQNLQARKLIQMYEAYRDLLAKKRIKSKGTLEKALIENMRQFLRDRQS